MLHALMIMDATLVLDIGKTNAKLTLLDAQAQVLEERRRPNQVLRDGPYPHLDIEGLWAWMQPQIRELAKQADIRAIVPVTHGATAALVDEAGLVLPVLDYEHVLPEAAVQAYGQQRPPFARSHSPRLPAGLNLGAQLAWLARDFPAEFARSHHILSYPQYWAWRLSGVAASEITSLGCHTDLWDLSAQDYSSLVDQQSWRALFPPRRNAWDALGPLRPELAQALGLSPQCQVLCGIHDSNASLLRYLPRGQAGEALSVLSTGTWVIAASLAAAPATLHEAQDMLSNLDALGRPVDCMRFMGGREFGALAGPEAPTPRVQDLAALVAGDSMALPCFAETGGPFGGRQGRLIGPAPADAAQRAALATLYCALVTDYCLDALGAQGAVVIEGAFARNELFARVLAALRPAQPVRVSDDESGTTAGGWLLHHWGQALPEHLHGASPLELPGLQAYRARWRDRVATPG